MSVSALINELALQEVWVSVVGDDLDRPRSTRDGVRHRALALARRDHEDEAAGSLAREADRGA